MFIKISIILFCFIIFDWFYFEILKLFWFGLGFFTYIDWFVSHSWFWVLPLWFFNTLFLNFVFTLILFFIYCLFALQMIFYWYFFDLLFSNMCLILFLYNINIKLHHTIPFLTHPIQQQLFLINHIPLHLHPTNIIIIAIKPLAFVFYIGRVVPKLSITGIIDTADQIKENFIFDVSFDWECLA